MAEHKIAEKDMIRLVEEVSKLDNERRAQLDKTEVAKILNELSLPSDLLDEALLRLQRQKSERRTLKLILGAAITTALLGALLAFFVLSSSNAVQQSYANVTATDAFFSQNAEGSVPVPEVSTGQTVYAQVTLHNVPVNSKLPMHAKWYKPDGSILKESSWSTRETTSQNWNTHAKCVIPPDAPAGKWMVEFSLGGRSVISKIFVVK